MMLICWSPEMGVYTVAVPGRARVVVMPEDIEPGGKHEKCRPAFLAAREAVESGKAIAGIHVNI